MDHFDFSIPQKILFGENRSEEIGSLVMDSGLSRVLLISGPHLTSMGYTDRIASFMEKDGVEVYKFFDVEANPSVETVESARKCYEDNGCEGIIALGGGSPMDVAKAAAVLVSHGGCILDYEGAHKVPGELIPVFAIPTTAGTGSEVTAFTVITDRARQYKLTVFSHYLIPKMAILDPALITSLPASVAAATGMDALVHAIEAYLSKAASLFSDAMAEKAINLIGHSLEDFVSDRSKLNAAGNMLLASTFAGIAFGWARLGNVHAMAHPLGGFFNIPHGVANAILLPEVLEFNAAVDKGKYEKIYRLMTEDTGKDFSPGKLIEHIRGLSRRLDISENLARLGVKEESIEAMAVDAMKSGNIQVNPRKTTLEDIITLYRKAMMS